MKVTSTYDAQIDTNATDHAQSITPPPNQTQDAAANSVNNHGATPEIGGNSPTGGVRETVTSQHQDVEEMVSERLSGDSEYQELKAKLDALKSFESDFAIIDGATVLGNGDGIITLAELKDLANSNESWVKAAAKRLLSNIPLWNEVASGVSGHNDNRVGTDDVSRLIRDTKAAMSAKTNDTRNEVKTELGIKTGETSTAQAATSAEDAAKAAQKAEATAIMTEAGQVLPKPAPSEMSGLEGASENLNNMIGWGESEIDRLTTLMGKTDDPAVLKKLENQINQMTRRMQQMTALMNQIMTAMQNISKMYSDIAMNSVRNIR